MVPFFRSYFTHIRMFSRNARLFLAGSFFFGFGWGTFWVLENLYFREIGLPEGTIGRILAFHSFGSVLIAIPASILASRLRLKRLLIGATLSAALAYSIIVSVYPMGIIYLASGVAGAAFMIHHVVSAPFFMRNSTPRERIYLFGVNWGTEMLAAVVGVAGGGWLARHLGDFLDSPVVGLRITLLTAAGLLSLAVVPYLFIHSPRPDPKEALEVRFWRIRLPPILPRLLTPPFLVGCGAGLIIPFLNLYFRDRFGLDPAAIGRIFAVGQIITAAGFVAGPAIARRFGMIQAVVSAELLSIPFFITLAFTRRLDLAVVAFWFRGALMNMNHPITSNFAMEAVEKKEQPLTNAAHQVTWNLSWMVSAQVGGILIEKHGFTLPMLITVVLYFISSCLFLLFFHDYERRVLAPKRQAELATLPHPPGDASP